MSHKNLDFRHKEVINITDARRLGFVQDVNAELGSGLIKSIVVPGSSKMFNIFSQESEITIPWSNVKCIGEDVILVEL